MHCYVEYKASVGKRISNKFKNCKNSSKVGYINPRQT